jgi:hypothetical protein
MLSEGKSGGAWEPFKKKRSCGNQGVLNRKKTSTLLVFNSIFLSIATTCSYGLRGLPSWAWQ